MWARSPCLLARSIHTRNTITPLATAPESQLNPKDAHVPTLASLLKQCDSLSVGRQAHDFITKEPRYANNTFLSNFLIEMYGHFGCLYDAQSVFDRLQKCNLHSWNILMNVYGRNSGPFEASIIFGRMPMWDIVSWTSLIMAFSQHGHGKEALSLFNEMFLLEFLPNKITFLCSLEACISLVQGQDIHIAIVKYGYEKDRLLGTALLSLYGECGFLPDALKVFRSISGLDTASWNAMIVSVIHSGEYGDALIFIRKMQFEGFNPDQVSFISVLDASRSLNEGLDMHALVICLGLEQNVILNNTLISMYGKYDCLLDALSVFRKMPHQTIVSWNALITAFADNLYGNEALHTFFQMENGGFVADMVSFLGALRGCTSLASLELGQVVHSLLMESQYGLDVVLGNTMITMYGWCGSVDDAKIVFEKLLSPNIVSWRSMIGIYCRDGKGEEALGLFYQMHLQGFKPDEAILVGALEACATLGAHEQGQRVHAYLAEVGVFEVLVSENTLLSLYGNCGNLCDAWAIFRRMEKRDIISWTSIITGFCLCGYSKAALDLFSRMQLEGLIPDRVTFLCVLSAFNHDGQVDDSKHFFAFMVTEFFEIDNKDHFLLMVDLLGRAGRLDEAEGLIKEAPAEIYSEACLCLLGACKVHGDIERGVYVANQIINMDLNTPLVHVMLSNLYAAMGRPDEAALMREALGRIRMQT